MSAERPIPEPLNEIEHLLQQFAPQASAINRDALMYRAGWSAAKTRPRIPTHWCWPTCSAVLAATLILLIAFPPTRSLQQAAATQSIDDFPQIKQATKNTRRAAKPHVKRATSSPRLRYLPKASLLVLRERALRQDFMDFPVDTRPDEIPTAAEPTNRQLLDELLPNTRTFRFRVWPDMSFGETT